MPFEVALPDVHDDDAAATLATPTSDHSGRSVPDVPVSGHSVHVDHCSHGHLLAAMEPATSGIATAGPRRPIAALTVVPPAVFTPPRFRPPIA